MSAPDEQCEVTAEHPELGELRCELEAGHEGAHVHTVAGDDVVEWDDVDDDAGRGGPDWDLEAFVKALPAGVCLCPMCLGQGAVIEEPPFDPTTHMCPTCQGRTRVRTGAVTGEEVERPCPTCKAHGWLSNDPNEPPASPATAESISVGDPRDYAGRTPADPEFDWSRVVDVVPPAEPEPVV